MAREARTSNHIKHYVITVHLMGSRSRHKEAARSKDGIKDSFQKGKVIRSQSIPAPVKGEQITGISDRSSTTLFPVSRIGWQN